MMHLQRGILILLAALVGAGCLRSRPVEPTRTYILVCRPAITAAAPTAARLGIRPFTAARPYALSMAYLSGAHRIAYRVKDEWGETPGVMVTRVVADAIVATGRFSDVGHAGNLARPDLLLTGEVRKFHEDRQAASPEAVVEARFELRAVAGAQAVWAKTLDARETLNEDSAGAFAEAMSRAVTRIAEEAASAIASAELPTPFLGDAP